MTQERLNKMLDSANTASDQKSRKKVITRLWKFIIPYQKQLFVLISLALLTAIVRPAQPLLIQSAIDHYIFKGDYQGLVSICLFMFIILLVQAVLTYAHTYLAGWLGQVLIKDIRVALFRHVLQLRLKFYDRTPIGHLMTRNISDVQALSQILSAGVAALIADILFTCVILSIMFYTHWQLTLVSLALTPLLIVSSFIFKNKMKHILYTIRNAVSDLNVFVQEHITGMSIIQLFGTTHQESEKFKKINHHYHQATLKFEWYHSIYFPIAEAFAVAGTGLLIWYGALGALHQEISLGVLIAFLMYIRMFFAPLRNLAERLKVLQSGFVSMHRILDLLDHQEHVTDRGNYSPAQLQGHIQFQRVWFAYNEQDYVLKDISFEVKTGETVALVGATGAGKSSIIRILNRFYEINQGVITLDGVPLENYQLTYLRSRIGVVLQDVFLFANSLEENIRLGNASIEAQKLQEAITLVGAWDFINRLPGKLAYNVMERGATLSMGQRQLISFIRALAYNPQIIVLDEATSSIDLETEQLVQKAIDQLMQGRTTLVIAHRLSTIQKADKIIVLDRGEIKEQGTHAELIEKNAWYAQLHRSMLKNQSS